MAVVNAEPAATKSAAMCSQMGAANINRINAEIDDGGCAAAGPPFTYATGLGWDVSTEPKNREDMRLVPCSNAGRRRRPGCGAKLPELQRAANERGPLAEGEE